MNRVIKHMSEDTRVSEDRESRDRITYARVMKRKVKQ